MSTTTDLADNPSDERRDYHAGHVTWCTNHDAEFTEHSESEPYCSHLLHGIALIPEGEIVKAQVWVQPTAAFTHGRFTPAEYAERERTYRGVELFIET